jgi:MarR family transcriptional regulator, organic hydroperoxide resistance regulator
VPQRTLPPPPLNDQLCFALYGASMAVGRVYKPLLDELGITYPQYLLLSALWERDGQTVGGLAERLLLEPSTVTPLAKRLAEAGFVTRERNPRNERQVVVRLTPAGRDMQARCTCLGERLMEVSALSTQELRDLTGAVRALRDAVGGATKGRHE